MSRKVLVVDDEEDVLLVIKKRLELKGYVVNATKNGAETLKVLTEYVPDVVLLDYFLPDTNGLELFNKIRGISLLSGVPIIFMSANVEKLEEIEKTVKASGYISKPMEIDVLVNKIENCFK